MRGAQVARGELHPAPADESGELLVADSWLVVDGAVRGYEEHWRRFGRSCRELGVGGSDLHDFAVAVTAALPRRGERFPRVDLARVGDDLRLALRLRAAPEREHEARVWSAPRNDLRRHPRRKGPDLAWLSSLRSRAQKAGADEALIRDERGHLLEGSAQQPPVVGGRGALHDTRRKLTAGGYPQPAAHPR